MSRGLAAAASALVSGEVVRRTAAVALSFPSGWVRLNGSPADLVIGGETYLGVGGLGAISTAQEGNDLAAYDLTVSLSGVPADSIALAITEAYQGRPGTVWEVVCDENWQPAADPFVVFRGRMDQMTIDYGPTCTVSVRMVNRLADWERAKVSRYTDEEQQRRHPNDLGMQFVASTVEKTIVFPQPLGGRNSDDTAPSSRLA